LYEGGNKVLWLPNQAYLLCSCDQLIVQLNTLENARRSISWPPRSYLREAAGQTLSRPQWDTRYGSGLPGYQEGGSSYYRHGTPRPSHRARTSASAEFPHWYYPLERYIRYMVARWRGSDESRAGLMSSSTCRWRYTCLLTRRSACCTASSTTSTSTLMLRSCKDLTLGAGSAD
jgi:hypothetical protein